MKTLRDGEGLGLVTFNYAGKTFYGYTGGGDNYGSWLVYEPQEKLAFAYTTNAKIYPVAKIVSGAIDIYYDQPFQIPTFEAMAVGPEVLDRYVGVYLSAGAPVKFTITRKDGQLFVQPGNDSATAVEATADNIFQAPGGKIVLEFDLAKKQMTLRRAGGERIFTKDQ